MGAADPISHSTRRLLEHIDTLFRSEIPAWVPMADRFSVEYECLHDDVVIARVRPRGWVNGDHLSFLLTRQGTLLKGSIRAERLPFWDQPFGIGFEITDFGDAIQLELAPGNFGEAVPFFERMLNRQSAVA